MKQTCKRLALLLTAVLLALSLAACGGEKYTLGGVYSPGRIIPSGSQEQSYEEYVDEATADIRDNPFYESLRAMYYYSYDFQENGVVVQTTVAAQSEGTYTLDGNTVTITMDGEETSATYDPENNTLTFTESDGDVWILEPEAGTSASQ